MVRIAGRSYPGYATRRGSGFHFVILVSTKIIPLIKKKRSVSCLDEVKADESE